MKHLRFLGMGPIKILIYLEVTVVLLSRACSYVHDDDAVPADFNSSDTSPLVIVTLWTSLGEAFTPPSKSLQVPKHLTQGRLGVKLCNTPDTSLLSGISQQ